MKQVEKKVKIGKWEVTAILVNALCLQVFLNLPRTMAELAGPAAWMVTVYVMVMVLIIFTVIIKLYKPFEGMDILDVAHYAMGVPGRVAAGIIVLFHLVLAISIILREFGEDMKVIALEVSPISYVLLFFIVGMLVSAYMGLEAISRLHSFAVPVVIVGFIIIIVGVSPYYRVLNLFPIMGKGAKAILWDGLSRISIYSSLIFFFLSIPFVGREDTKNIGYTAILLTGILTTLSCLAYLAVAPFPVAIEYFLPIYQLARLIYLGRFFQRIESVFMIIWAASALMYLSTGLFFMLYVFKKTFAIKYYRPLIIPFTVLVFNFSLLPPNLMWAVEIETKYFRRFAWITTFAVTAAILAAAHLKKSVEGKGKKA